MIKGLALEQASQRVSVGAERASTVADRLLERLVDLLRLRQRAAQDPRAVPGVEAACQMGFDGREEALAAAARPVPEGQRGPLEELPGEQVEQGGVAGTYRLGRNLDASVSVNPVPQVPGRRRANLPGRVDGLVCSFMVRA